MHRNAFENTQNKMETVFEKVQDGKFSETSEENCPENELKAKEKIVLFSI